MFTVTFEASVTVFFAVVWLGTCQLIWGTQYWMLSILFWSLLHLQCQHSSILSGIRYIILSLFRKNSVGLQKKSFALFENFKIFMALCHFLMKFHKSYLEAKRLPFSTTSKCKLLACEEVCQCGGHSDPRTAF